MLIPVTWLAANLEIVETGTSIRISFNTLGLANDFASGTGEDDAGSEITRVSTWDLDGLNN